MEQLDPKFRELASWYLAEKDATLPPIDVRAVEGLALYLQDCAAEWTADAYTDGKFLLAERDAQS